MKHNEKSQSIGTRNFPKLFLKQITASILCTAFILGMNSCDNVNLNQYATAFGNAIRYNFDFKQTAKEVANWIKGAVSEEKEDFSPQYEFSDNDSTTYDDSVTFQ